MYVILIFVFTAVCMYYAMMVGQLPAKMKTLINCVLAVLFSVLIAFRPLSVPDTITYLDMYKQIDANVIYPIVNFVVIQFDAEIGYVLFCQIAKLFFGNVFRLFLFVIPIVNIGLIAYGSRIIIKNVNKDFFDSKENNYVFILVLCLYASYFGLIYNGVTLRAGFALSLTICSLAMYIDKKYIKMILFLVLAFSFHKMAITGLLIIILYHMIPRFKRSNYFFIWLSLGIIGASGLGNRVIKLIIPIMQAVFLKIPFLSSYSHYSADYVNYGGYGYKNIFFYFIGLVLLFWKVDNGIYYKLLNIYYIGLTMIIFLNNINGSRRIYEFITVYAVMLLYIMYKYGSGEKPLKWMWVSGIALIGNVMALSIWNVF